MKIDSSVLPLSTPTLRRQEGAPAPSQSSSPSSAEVQLSALATQLQGEGAPVDRARINEIKQAISEGRFSINAGAIADRLLATAKELVDSQRKA